MSRRVYPDLNAFFRANPDISAQDLAAEFGISVAYMSMLRWSTRQPRLPLALKIAARCNVPLESLLQKHTYKQAV